MNGFIRLFILSALIATITSCSSRPVDEDMDLGGADSSSEVVADDSGPESISAETPSEESSNNEDDFADFDESSGGSKEAAKPSESNPDVALEEEFSEAEGADQQAKASEAPAEGDADLEAEFSDAEETDKQAKSSEAPAEGDADLDAEFSEAEGTDKQAKAATEDSELSLDDEMSGEQPATPPAKQAAKAEKDEDELSLDETPGEAQATAPEPAPLTPPVPEIAPAVPVAPTVEIPVAETPAPAPVPVPEVAPPTPVVEQTPQPEAPSVASANITDLKFKANDAGGTVIVQADRPITYTTRTNPDLNQFIIEVENARLPDRLKRPLNTRDIKGSIGAIDAYQNPGASTARFVIQLREGVTEPTVQMEGNNLLIVANMAGGAGAPEMAQAPAPEIPQESSQATSEEVPQQATQEAPEPAMEVSDSKILPSQNLTEFLAGNTKFYGKKISIETNSMDIRDALSLITEESGVNMVISEDVKGPLSMKLRQVPWDQALVVIMKAKKLGYTRQGNVLRIAPLQDLKAEEDDATKLAQARKNVEPLKVRMFPVSYAKVDELEKKIKDFLGDRGRVVGDARTNALVVTDIQENLERAARLIASLDTQPPQVLIESKIVEAQESFTRNIGVNWGASGAPIKLGSTARGPVNMNPSFSINPSANSPGSFNFNLSVGTLDVFGTLQAALALSESEEQVKIISAPRIMTMTNEKADINQTTEVPVRQVTQNGTATQETFQFKPLTLKLEVTPQVTADGSVIMKVLVNRQFRGADVSSAGQGAFAVNSREANTRVLVKNGQTAVIGGIYQSDAVEGETGVPWLRELPIVSYLFKTKNVNKSKSELLVFLTPRIIGPVGAEASAAPVEDF